MNQNNNEELIQCLNEINKSLKDINNSVKSLKVITACIES